MNQNMSPVEWAKRPIEKYADFTGRAPRAEYWWYALALIIIYLVGSWRSPRRNVRRLIYGSGFYRRIARDDWRQESRV